MPKFYLGEIQEAGGCDYTIACGQRIEELSSETFEEAKKQVLDHYNSESGQSYVSKDDDFVLERAMIFELKEEIDIEDLIQKNADAKNDNKEKGKQEKEKQEYERLKEKFDKHEK